MAWSSWTSCSKTCAGGRQQRERIEYNCSRTQESRVCQPNPCPISPQIFEVPRNQTALKGNTVNFTCKANGLPKPRVWWTFNDGNLSSNAIQHSIKNGSLLLLSNVTKDMGGKYQCVAENIKNVTASTATLTVLELPAADVIPKHPTLTVGDELVLTCKVNKATLEIKWKKDGASEIPRAQIDKREGISILSIPKVVTSDRGEYSCEAHNKAGYRSFPATVIVEAAVTSSSESVQWYYILGPVSAVIVLFAVGWYIYRRRMTAMTSTTDGGVAMQNEIVDKWEIAIDRIDLREAIGRGAFGSVWRALLSQPDGRRGNRTVAAKCYTPISGEQGRKALMREIELGKLLGGTPHPNIVQFIGCVTTEDHPILIMEYLGRGDLLGYLRSTRGIHDHYHHGVGGIQELEPYDLVLFAKQIAAGMVYLATRGIIHRDLAARNVLLDNHSICKVTDFGLAYQDFKYGAGNAKKGCIPIKWTAPEILFGRPEMLSTKSDVWSYGVVLYEIFTIGGIPYEGWSESKTLMKIKDGFRMPKPEHIDESLYQVMMSCWESEIDHRPHFENLRHTMDTYLRERTYEELLNMGKYDGLKYANVDDCGAVVDLPTDEENEQGACAILPGNEAGEQGACANVPGIEEGEQALETTRV
ncbi:hypothetical protein ACROYT_G042112 [Oculina patagonica]